MNEFSYLTMSIIEESLWDKTKEFVKNNKSKLAAPAALAAGAGAAYAADKGYLGQGAQDAMHDAKDKLGFGGEEPKSEAPKQTETKKPEAPNQSITDFKKNEYSDEDNAQAQKELETKKPKSATETVAKKLGADKPKFQKVEQTAPAAETPKTPKQTDFNKIAGNLDKKIHEKLGTNDDLVEQYKSHDLEKGEQAANSFARKEQVYKNNLHHLDKNDLMIKSGNVYDRKGNVVGQLDARNNTIELNNGKTVPVSDGVIKQGINGEVKVDVANHDKSPADIFLKHNGNKARWAEYQKQQAENAAKEALKNSKISVDSL